ncbi:MULTISPECIES: hypothetical protein [unclassified Nonomuraea]|uniref:hypothetical protein n=1 Tax=unclassified Nonomuraea TaxID=2593643 RepID=UPI0035BF501F
MTPGPDGFSTEETLSNEPPRRRFPRSLLLVATAALVAVTGAGVAAASVFSPTPAPTPTAGDTTTPSASPSSTTPPGRGWGGHRMGRALHGEFVVPDVEGRYVTVATQYGDVTAVDQDSITVRSEDGYTKEYAVTGDTRINRGGEGIDAVKAGQKVMVMAKVEGGTATAVSIRDATMRKGWGRDGKGDHRHHDHRPGRPPTGTPTPSAAPTMTVTPTPTS